MDGNREEDVRVSLSSSTFYGVRLGPYHTRQQGPSHTRPGPSPSHTRPGPSPSHTRQQGHSPSHTRQQGHSPSHTRQQGHSPSPYHTRQQGRLEQVARGAEHITQHPLPSTFQPGILGPPATWRVFRRQAEAIACAQVMREGLMVFSCEGEAVGSGGKRNFVVTHPTQMWLRQSERLPEKRSTYEVIQEKAVCKLYFDLEFLHASNPGRDGSAMTNTLIDVVSYFLHHEFNITCLRKDIIDLRGTSDLKFSRHLIYNFPGHAFATNAHVGSFVRMVCSKVKLWKEEKEPIEVPNISLQNIKDLFVYNSKDCEVIFCDEGVYTKNRNFRLFLSTKYGQNAPLLIAEANEYIPKLASGNTKNKQIFFDSLITLVDSNVKILTYKDTERTPKEHSVSNTTRNTDADVEGYRQSPYPEIDDFIQKMIGVGNIHSWHYFSHSEVIVYNIVRYRFCLNIGRAHKSNNILYVVNLKSASYYQKCHDPDCRDFRSATLPLPKNTVFWQDMSEDQMMEWVQSTQEEDSSNKVANIANDSSKGANIANDSSSKAANIANDSSKAANIANDSMSKGPNIANDSSSKGANIANDSSKAANIANDSMSKGANIANDSSKAANIANDSMSKGANIADDSNIAANIANDSNIAANIANNSSKAANIANDSNKAANIANITLSEETVTQHLITTDTIDQWDYMEDLFSSQGSSHRTLKTSRDHLEDLFSSQGSSNKSFKSSHGSSLASNPWDKLSQISSPSTSFAENLSQSNSNKSSKSSQGSSLAWDKLSQISSQSTSFAESRSQLSQSQSVEGRGSQDTEPGSHDSGGYDSDQEFLRAVRLAEEQLQCVGSEMEIVC